MIANHTQLLNALIEKHGLKSYLEIGVQSKDQNFNKIKCDIKIGVDPDSSSGVSYCMTSDRFFELHKLKAPTFDLIFIDGLHHADQVQRDFENSLRSLSDNGFIVIHDVLPENEAGTTVPRETKIWWGDVYKFAMTICEYDNIKYKTFDIDNGCMLVWKDKGAKGEDAPVKISWNNFVEFGRLLMNVTNDTTL